MLFCHGNLRRPIHYLTCSIQDGNQNLANIFQNQPWRNYRKNERTVSTAKKQK